MLELITIQKVFAENRQLHSYLASKGLNKQTNLFFIEKNLTSNSAIIIMLSNLGHLFRFSLDKGKYISIRFEDPNLLYQAIRITEQAVYSKKYSFYKDTLDLINRNLNYTPNKQGLF